MGSKSLFPIFLFTLSIIAQCSPSDRKPVGDQQAEMRFDQYYVQGKQLYLKHCANCHGKSGEGLKKLIPPLVQADYFLSDIENAVCIISKGLDEKIVVNGVTFQQPMPAHTDLRFIEIAEIITYISNSWGAGAGILSARKVEQVYNSCP